MVVVLTFFGFGSLDLLLLKYNAVIILLFWEICEWTCVFV